MADNTWTLDREIELRKLWEKRIPKAELAKIFGVTENAISGKTHRMGLRRERVGGVSGQNAITKARRQQQKNESKRRQKEKAAQKERLAQKDLAEKALANTPAKADQSSVPTAAAPVAPPRPVIISKDAKPWTKRVGSKECAYPIDDVKPQGWRPADTKSCCNPTDDGQRYCRAHIELMFLPPQARRSRATRPSFATRK
jgi:hypothetical protein